VNLQNREWQTVNLKFRVRKRAYGTASILKDVSVISKVNAGGKEDFHIKKGSAHFKMAKMRKEEPWENARNIFGRKNF